jgi:hypothetical protein
MRAAHTKTCRVHKFVQPDGEAPYLEAARCLSDERPALSRLQTVVPGQLHVVVHSQSVSAAVQAAQARCLPPYMKTCYHRFH